MQSFSKVAIFKWLFRYLEFWRELIEKVFANLLQVENNLIWIRMICI